MPQDNDPKTVTADEALKAFYDAKLSPEAKARREAAPDSDAVTDDQVQHAADMADGKDDGIVNEPESDVQAAIHVYRDGPQDAPAKLDLAWKASLAIFKRGERHIDPEDWGELGKILGPALLTFIKGIVLLVK